MRPKSEGVLKRLARKHREMFDPSGKRKIDKTDVILKLDREGNMVGDALKENQENDGERSEEQVKKLV